MDLGKAGKRGKYWSLVKALVQLGNTIIRLIIEAGPKFGASYQIEKLVVYWEQVTLRNG